MSAQRPRPDPARGRDPAWPPRALAALLLAQALLLAAWAWPAPLQDLPNHLARAVAIADLAFHGGARFGAWYELHWTFAPYVLADAVAAAGVELIGADATGRLLAAAAALAVPLGVAWCAWALGATRAAAALAGLAATVFALDYTLAAGYLAFKYSAALSLVAVGCLVRAIDAPQPGRIAALALAAVATYLAHLSGFVMLVAATAALAGHALLEQRRLARGALVGLALAGAIGALHLLGAAQGSAGPAFHYGTAAEKLHGALHSLALGGSRAERAIDLAALAALAAGVVLAAAAALRGERRAVRALWLLASALAAYAVLPQSQPGFTWDTDLRALPQVFGFAAIAAALAAQSRPVPLRAATLWLALLAAAQLAVVAGPLRDDARRVAALRAAQASLPAGSRVFPVVSVGLDARLNPLIHAASYATVDQSALVPYVFAGHAGGHMGYFRLRAAAVPIIGHRWYAEPGAAPDASLLRSRHDYVAATLPWDESRLGLCLEPLRRTAVAATYRIAGQRRADGSCERGPLAAR